MRAYRFTQTKHVATAFDGEGARLNGGRWNSVGTSMVYTAGSESLAMLEILVHLEDILSLYHRYSVIPITFHHSLVRKLKASELPANWFSPVPLASTQSFGDRWIRDRSSVILEVPSAVTHSEKNYLINPMHPDFAKITIETAFALEPDPRFRGLGDA